jgi:hypothetical protein
MCREAIYKLQKPTSKFHHPAFSETQKLQPKQTGHKSVSSAWMQSFSFIRNPSICKLGKN